MIPPPAPVGAELARLTGLVEQQGRELRALAETPRHLPAPGVVARASTAPPPRPQPAPPPPPPRVRIGRVDVFVTAPAPRPPRAGAAPTTNTAASRLYLRRV